MVIDIMTEVYKVQGFQLIADVLSTASKQFYGDSLKHSRYIIVDFITVKLS